MNNNTINPESFPLKYITDEERDEMIAWAANQPPHDLDTCVNRKCRWTFSVTNHGIWSQYVIRDNGTNETFSPEDDGSNW